MQEHARAVGQRVGVHLERVDAVLEDVLRGDRVVRQLAGLAGRHEAGAQLAGDRGAEDEAARLGRHHEVDLQQSRPVGEMPDGVGQRFGGLMLRRAAGKELDGALDGLEGML